MGLKTVDLLLEENGLTVDDLAERASMPMERIEAIAVGRWTPGPNERIRIAAALNVPVEDVSWGHTVDPRNLRYRRFGMKDQF